MCRAQPTMDKPKREAILDLAKYTNERIRVKFTGGREGALLRLLLSSWVMLITRSDWCAQGIRPAPEPCAR